MIQVHLAELISNNTQFEDKKNGKLTKSFYENFVKANNDLISTIEDLLNKYVDLSAWNKWFDDREANNTETDNKGAIQRFQKVLTEQKKKFAAFTNRRWHLIQEEYLEQSIICLSARVC